MKKVISVLLTLVLIFTLVAGLDIQAQATSWYNDFTYELINGQVYISGYYGTASNVSIPSSIYGIKVVGIDSYTFDDNNYLYKVTVPSTVTYIERAAFYYCDNLQEVYIMNPNCYLENYAFYDCYDAVVYSDDDSLVESHMYYQDAEFYPYDTHYYSYEVFSSYATTGTTGKSVVRCSTCGKIIANKTYNRISSISLSKTSYTYSGNRCTPSVKVKDSSGKTISSNYYSVSYSGGGTNAGTYKVTVKFSGAYRGTHQKTYKIKKASVNKSKIKLKDMTYKGKATTPKITYRGKTLKAKRDYTIKKISGNKSVGTAKVKVKFKGNYSGSASLQYKVVPANVKGLALKSRTTNSITVKWRSVKGASGYKIYRFNGYKYKLYKTTSATSATVNRANKDYTAVSLLIKAYKNVGGKAYNSTGKYYYNCIQPPTPRYTVINDDFNSLKVIFADKTKYKNLQIQRCSDKSFNKYYNIANYYVGINEWWRNYNLYPGNQNYYIRCRQYYYNRKGGSVFGKWGPVKKVYVRG